jgi:phosphoribosylamine--glycine ligase
MLVSEGYPGNFEKGKDIFGLNLTSDTVVFHAGTKNDQGKVVTNGGRVLAVSAWGPTLYEALEVSYRNAGLISWDGIYYRTDIGFDLL